MRESLSKLEVLCMLISFGTVIMITLSQANTDQDLPSSDENSTDKRMFLSSNDNMAGLVGCIFCVCVGLINGLISVQTRVMSELGIPVTMFHVGFFACVATAVWLLAEHAISGEGTLRILTLESGQLCSCLLSGFINVL